VSCISPSYAHKNGREARALKQWLSDVEPALAKKMFLDSDPLTGSQAEGDWKALERDDGEWKAGDHDAEYLLPAERTHVSPSAGLGLVTR
jgi:hypothetical protein